MANNPNCHYGQDGCDCKVTGATKEGYGGFAVPRSEPIAPFIGPINIERIVHCYSPIFGCDPELFFERGGQVVGAEKVLPGGAALAARPGGRGGRGCSHKEDVNQKAFVLDGVQVEMNPNPHGCRANLGDELTVAFIALKAHLATQEGVSVTFKAVITLEQAELDSLSEKAKILGCAPSYNGYDAGATISLDAAKSLKRSAGGHIHLGLKGHGSNYSRNPVLPNIFAHRERLFPLMDVLVGNTCVLIDRDPNAPERRKVYGRAGEYRLPNHGFEYRTLSNFWMRSYQLMSFVMGMSRLATSVLGTTVEGEGTMKQWDAEADLLSRVNLKDVRDAINTNDLALAMRNWIGVREFIRERVPKHLDDGSGLCAKDLDEFDFFVKQVHEKGLESWFPQDPLEHWCSKPNGHGIGWESFLQKTVKPLMTPGTPIIETLGYYDRPVATVYLAEGAPAPPFTPPTLVAKAGTEYGDDFDDDYGDGDEPYDNELDDDYNDDGEEVA